MGRTSINLTLLQLLPRETPVDLLNHLVNYFPDLSPVETLVLSSSSEQFFDMAPEGEPGLEYVHKAL